MANANRAGTLWVKEDAYLDMVREGERKYPLETGGILMGYHAQSSFDVVVTRVIGPGDNAKHSRARFVPDTDSQTKEIARVYGESGQIYTYLGDWHTHPNGTTDTSILDRCTLYRIAFASGARAPHPVMLILAGKVGTWQPGAVRWVADKRLWVFAQILEMRTQILFRKAGC
jgi:integrative and conjugative element protein (TIGR02256 family)